MTKAVADDQLMLIDFGAGRDVRFFVVSGAAGNSRGDRTTTGQRTTTIGGVAKTI